MTNHNLTYIKLLNTAHPRCFLLVLMGDTSDHLSIEFCKKLEESVIMNSQKEKELFYLFLDQIFRLIEVAFGRQNHRSHTKIRQERLRQHQVFVSSSEQLLSICFLFKVLIKWEISS